MKRRVRGTGSIESYVDARGRERHRARLILESGHRKPMGVYDSKAEAQNVLDAAADKAAAEGLAITGATVRSFGAAFLDRRESEGVRGIRTERCRWEVLVNASPIADLPLRGVQRRDAKEWVTWLRGRKIKYSHSHSRNGKKLSRVTAQNALNLLRKAFDVAVDDEILAANPFAGLKLPRDKGRTDEPWTYLTPEEQTALLAATPEPEKFLVAFAIGTGLRQGEQWSLRWEDVEWGAGKAQIVVRYGSEGKPTKSGKIRRVPLFGLAADALAAHVVHSKHSVSPLVFHGPRGDRRQKKEPKHWKEWVRAAGITRNVRWHDLRHTCASSLVAGWWGRRWSLYEVKEMLGHASITTTERYAHLAESALKLAARETKPDVSPLTGEKSPPMLAEKTHETD